MKRLACILLIASILLCCLSFDSNAHATTTGGIIYTNTHWQAADSPITFNNTVVIANNATLTIDPGVTVNMGTYALFVYGCLNATGTPSRTITFQASMIANFTYPNSVINAPIFINPSTGPGPSSSSTTEASIIQYANLNGVNIEIDSSSPTVDHCSLNFNSPNTPLITVSGGSPVISNCTLDYTGQASVNNTNIISINSGSPLIANNQLEGTYAGNNNNGINVYSGTPTITGNKFQGNGYLNAIVTSSQSSYSIQNNVFSNCLVGVKAQGGTLSVQNNQFLSGTDGIDIRNGASLTISGNLIDSNSRYGIDGGANINSNTITNNQIGIHNPDLGSINNNNIVANRVNSITATTANIDASNNWWGTTDVPTINQTIYDKKIDYHLGTITFVPFLTSPSSTAPPIPASTPTITPIPTAIETEPTSTPQPLIEPTATPIPYTQTFTYQIGQLFNLNLITTIIATLLVLAWVIVILGYATKKVISKYRGNDKQG